MEDRGCVLLVCMQMQHPPNYCIGVGVTYGARATKIKFPLATGGQMGHIENEYYVVKAGVTYGSKHKTHCENMPSSSLHTHTHTHTHTYTHGIIPSGTYCHLYHLVQLWWRASRLPPRRLDNLQGCGWWFPAAAFGGSWSFNLPRVGAGCESRKCIQVHSCSERVRYLLRGFTMSAEAFVDSWSGSVFTCHHCFFTDGMSCLVRAVFMFTVGGDL